MYNNVSNAFRRAFKQTYQERHLKIKLTYKNAAGNEVIENLTQEDIVSNSFVINSSSIPNSSFELGAVVAAECSFTLWNDDKHFAGCKLREAKVEPEVGIRTSSGIEYCPMGVFWIDTCGKSYGKTINITATDGLMKLEKAIDYSKISFPITFQNLFNLALSECGIELSSESEGLYNSSALINEFDDSSITWRDVVSAAAIGAGGFARMDRAGKLQLVQFLQHDFNTYEIDYAGMRMSLETDEQIKITGIAYYGDNNNDNTLIGTSDYVITIDSNAIFENMDPDDYSTLRYTIFNVYKNFTYYPFSLDFAGDPILEAGDFVDLDETDEGNIVSLITESTFRFSQKSSLEGKGVDELDKNFLNKKTAKQSHTSGGGGDIYVTNKVEIKPNLLQRSIFLKGFNYKDLSKIYLDTTDNKLCNNVWIGTVAPSVTSLAPGMVERWSWKTDYLKLVKGYTYTISFLCSNCSASDDAKIGVMFASSNTENYRNEVSASRYAIGEVNVQYLNPPIYYQWVSITFNTLDLPSNFKGYNYLNMYVYGCSVFKVKLEANKERTQWVPHISEKYSWNNNTYDVMYYIDRALTSSGDPVLANAEEMRDLPSIDQAGYYHYTLGYTDYFYTNVSAAAKQEGTMQVFDNSTRAKLLAILDGNITPPSGGGDDSGGESGGSDDSGGESGGDTGGGDNTETTANILSDIINDSRFGVYQDKYIVIDADNDGDMEVLLFFYNASRSYYDRYYWLYLDLNYADNTYTSMMTNGNFIGINYDVAGDKAWSDGEYIYIHNWEGDYEENVNKYSIATGECDGQVYYLSVSDYHTSEIEDVHDFIGTDGFIGEGTGYTGSDFSDHI